MFVYFGVVLFWYGLFLFVDRVWVVRGVLALRCFDLFDVLLDAETFGVFLCRYG